ncbi:hypothetical protein PVK06_044447 [Gossypium arboreum]|uniref:Retrotransposon Copia-like N-terminal domain-containing protein n=1 Tax=Gossypium arboreum TaxID=29729 RepID=A0ABR0MR79_GOSAR|nr:hypothetical protein PVK06_044447 [Gossypium arboreum]
MSPSPMPIDPSHPLYLHPSNTLGTLLVSHQLTRVENYNIWSRSLRIALLAKNKVGFIDGSYLFEDTIKVLQPQWERCNALVLSWILNSVSQELSAGIVFACSATRVWSDLKERFDKVDGSQIYFLHREIAMHVQSTSSISVYHTRLRLLWDEYDVIAPLASCSCDSMKVNVENLKQQRLFQFLMGLNESYSMVRSQVLLMKPLPSVN